MGHYKECIQASLIAREWTLTNQVPLPSICLGRAYLALGNHYQAKVYFIEAHRFAGDSLYEGLHEDEKEFLSQVIA
ncbi:hypothetical protein [Paenibacillus sp. L3-i20]|uniref:hypothetical protein n=1 Tax=Paenibacillus sp. L3-i20 TaxID=2905833 RepID=UPI001EE0C911|nr:hypothetical protein [Paenibacillus sp. L3-i20]GKU78153.1 hypothetical protein L3i20_v225500 [Paenibacillus sp. L3-i20]